MTDAPQDYEDNLFTLRDAAEYLRCSRGTIFNLIRSRELNVVDLKHEGTTRPDPRIKLSVLNAYIERHERQYPPLTAVGDSHAIQGVGSGKIHRYLEATPTGYQTACGTDPSEYGAVQTVDLEQAHPADLCKRCWKEQTND